MGNFINRYIINDITNTYNIESTIMSFSFNNNEKYYEIFCNPSYSVMILRRDHFNFIQLYNKLKIGSTYNFTCSNWPFTLDEIIDITNCEIYILNDKITGFLNIKNEINFFRNYEEVVLENNIDKRFLINLNIKQNVNIDKKYTIHYTKKFGSNFYIVLEIHEKNEI